MPVTVYAGYSGNRNRSGRRCFHVFILLFFLSVFPSGCGPGQGRHPATFVWADAEGRGRQGVVDFRYVFSADLTPREAVLHLFADSRYHMLVNGAFIAFGPPRAYPEHPLYDTFDLIPYLREGENTLRVKVLSNGMETFQVPRHAGGFIAWGEVVRRDGTRVSLETPGGWACRRSAGVDRDAPRFSFACGAIDVYDARREDEAPSRSNTGPGGWKRPVPLRHQQAWGRLTPHSLPCLTQDERLPRSVLGVYTLDAGSELYSFRVKLPDATVSEFRSAYPVIAYTWIHSPKAQRVRVETGWGDYYLNGRGPLPNRDEPPGRGPRRARTLDLRSGWNFFLVRHSALWGVWDYYMSVPGNAGLSLSAEKKIGSPALFMTAGPLSGKDRRRMEGMKHPPARAEGLPRLSAGWVAQPRNGGANNPVREMAWRDFSAPQSFDPFQVRDLHIQSRTDTALVFDMGAERLGRIFVDFEAPRDTVVDVGFSEDLIGNRPWLYRDIAVTPGARHIARGGAGRLETFKPYGFRYLQVNITRNKGPVILRKAGAVQQVYPFEQVGSFSCSDPLLNAVWEMGWRTLRLCAEDSYTDTPFRERALYAGDLLPEFAVTLAVSGDTRLARRSLELLHEKYREVFSGRASADYEDYPLISLLILGWYVDRTGDLEFARTLFPGYARLMNALLKGRGEDGLFEPVDAFIEWSPLDREARLTAMHALTARAFAVLAKLADKLDRGEDADAYHRAAADLADTVRARFWDPDRGAYSDGIGPAGRLDSFTPVSSAWPALFGMVPRASENRLRAFFGRSLQAGERQGVCTNTTPYGGFTLLGALYRLGCAGTAEQYMRRCWGPMTKVPNATAWERFPGQEGFVGTLCHAWSGGPTYYLSTCVLGVDLGFPVPAPPDRLVISPQAEGIDWARGVVPHPSGPVHVDWRVSGESLFVRCRVPEGIAWTVKPRGRLASKVLWVNGKRAGGP